MILISYYTSNTGRIIIEGKKQLAPNNFIVVDSFAGISNMGSSLSKKISLVIEKMNRLGLVINVDYKFV